MKIEPDLILKDWLRHSRDAGVAHSRGSFTVDADQAEQHGLARLELCDVPLLLMAGAVEGGSRFFRVHGQRDVRLSWEGPTGPSGELALSLLRHARVDARWNPNGGVDLPPFFEDLLDPLAARCHHAPLHFIWSDRAMSSPHLRGGQMLVSASSQPRLVLVDRGVDFPLNAGFEGLDVVAWVAPLPGSPWPKRLLAGSQVDAQIARVARALRAAVG